MFNPQNPLSSEGNNPRNPLLSPTFRYPNYGLRSSEALIRTLTVLPPHPSRATRALQAAEHTLEETGLSPETINCCMTSTQIMTAATCLTNMSLFFVMVISPTSDKQLNLLLHHTLATFGTCINYVFSIIATIWIMILFYISKSRNDYNTLLPQILNIAGLVLNWIIYSLVLNHLIDDKISPAIGIAGLTINVAIVGAALLWLAHSTRTIPSTPSLRN